MIQNSEYDNFPDIIPFFLGPKETKLKYIFIFMELSSSSRIFSSTKQNKLWKKSKKEEQVYVQNNTLKAGNSPRIILQKTQSCFRLLWFWWLEREAQSRVETGKGRTETGRESSGRRWERRMASLRTSIFKRKRCSKRRLRQWQWQWHSVLPCFSRFLNEEEDESSEPFFYLFIFIFLGANSETSFENLENRDTKQKPLWSTCFFFFIKHKKKNNNNTKNNK